MKHDKTAETVGDDDDANNILEMAASVAEVGDGGNDGGEAKSFVPTLEDLGDMVRALYSRGKPVWMPCWRCLASPPVRPP